MKKILCLITALLLFVGTSIASDLDELAAVIQRSYANFVLLQGREYKDALNMSETKKDEEEVFKGLYKSYIDYYNNIINYYIENVTTPMDSEYVKKHKKEFLEYGFGLNITEGSWCLEDDYTMLLRFPEIPEVWIDWLKLQQKDITQNRNKCIKMGFCEGGTMTIPEREKAIIEFEKIEQKSEVIASIRAHDFDYIPYTSRELVDTYLMGNDLKPIFDRNPDDTKSLNKASKKSFEHFIKHHKSSKYWPIVNEYYKKLEQNNFLYSPDINGWLIDRLESMK